MKNLQKKEYNREKNKRLMADKYIDNRELERVKRTAKQEAEWEARARAQDQEAETVVRAEKHKKDIERAKRLLKGESFF